ncbi:DUF1593 domain-containing protein [Demequina silvatica]|uniref:DUF1593 domain-containing protein n=1 Tax=Demequina silvatica TaxID=1638988 RepID=UPI000786014A|nr:DUF1593 domain-containing protein [Demequina silvatica]
MTAADRQDGARRPRVIVTTDPELDDLNSMLRLVLYSNEIDLAGLIYSSSQFHWAGDPAAGVEPHRWPPAGARGHIDQAVDAYEQAWDNLRVHDARYPSPEHLRALVKQGNILTKGDTDQETDGSRLIEDVLLDGDDRQVFVQAWGGTNTIARALLSIEERAKRAGTWEDTYRTVVARTVITSFGKQDQTWDEYIRPHWPELELREVATLAWGYFARLVVRDEDQVYLTPEWMAEHVSGVGPIGSAYRVWGDGLQMAAGFDDEDYFGIAGKTKDELEALGYRVWCPVFPPGAWISEGDSSNFAMHIDNGLRNWEGPHFGGWGGRQAPSPSDPHEWVSGLAHDSLPEGMAPVETPFGTTVNDYAAARWLGAFQRDLATRLRWSVTPRFEDANHAPALTVEPGVDLSGAAGERVEVTLHASDPDGDAVALTAWEYREAGSCEGSATVELSGATLAIGIPADARAGDAIHVIVEAVDDAPVPSTSYARVVIRVA